MANDSYHTPQLQSTQNSTNSYKGSSDTENNYQFDMNT